MRCKAKTPDPLPLAELEYRLLYAVIVAGKSAKFADQAMHRLMDLLLRHNKISPFQAIKVVANMGQLDTFLRTARTGNYAKTARCFTELANASIDLHTCQPADLEKIHGIGQKTSRFFIMWTRPNERLAALDVHVLRWLGAQGYSVPRSTPSGGKYAELQAAFIHEAEKRGLTPRELDWQIWQAGSGYVDAVQTGPGKGAKA